jgi:hypothetical protein
MKYTTANLDEKKHDPDNRNGPNGIFVARTIPPPSRCVLLLFAVLAAWSVVGCGGDSAVGDSQPTLSAAKAREALLDLPYRYEFRNVKRPAGASAAVAGRVNAKHGTWFDFGIALGTNPDPVPIPRGGAEVVGNPGFVLSTNVLVQGGQGQFNPGQQFKTDTQWREAGHVATEIEQRLCKAITHEPCPV